MKCFCSKQAARDVLPNDHRLFLFSPPPFFKQGAGGLGQTLFCSAGCPLTRFVDHFGYQLGDPPVSASGVQGLKARATMPC